MGRMSRLAFSCAPGTVRASLPIRDQDSVLAPCLPAAGIAVEAAQTSGRGRQPGNLRAVEFRSYRDNWPADDPHANFKAEVAGYTSADPLPTLTNLSRSTGIPVDCLIRYVLVKYAASGADALLAMKPVVLHQMEEHIARAEGEGSDAARLRAYAALKSMIGWLALGEDERSED